MNPQIISALITGIISIPVGAFVGAWIQRKKLASDIEIALRVDRLSEYRKLWSLTEPLGWYGNSELTSEDVNTLLADLDHWYFDNGAGILLSEVSINEFEKLLLDLYNFEGKIDKIKKQGTKLRAALAYDIGGRKLPLLNKRPRKRELDIKIAIENNIVKTIND